MFLKFGIKKHQYEQLMAEGKIEQDPSVAAYKKEYASKEKEKVEAWKVDNALSEDMIEDIKEKCKNISENEDIGVKNKNFKLDFCLEVFKVINYFQQLDLLICKSESGLAKRR